MLVDFSIAFCALLSKLKTLLINLYKNIKIKNLNSLCVGILENNDIVSSRNNNDLDLSLILKTIENKKYKKLEKHKNSQIYKNFKKLKNNK